MPKPKPNAKPANPLVAKALALPPIKQRKSWLDLLPDSQQAEIIEAAKQWPDTGRPWTVLAQVVREQLGLEVSVRMIADILKRTAKS